MRRAALDGFLRPSRYHRVRHIAPAKRPNVQGIGQRRAARFAGGDRPEQVEFRAGGAARGLIAALWALARGSRLRRPIRHRVPVLAPGNLTRAAGNARVTYMKTFNARLAEQDLRKFAAKARRRGVSQAALLREWIHAREIPTVDDAAGWEARNSGNRRLRISPG